MKTLEKLRIKNSRYGKHGETANMESKFFRSLSGVTSLKQAFTIAYFNADCVTKDYETKNMKLVSTSIVKLMEEERKKKLEIETINKLTNQAYGGYTLNELCTVIQENLEEGVLWNVIFKIGRKWYYYMCECDIEDDELQEYQKFIDKNAFLINGYYNLATYSKKAIRYKLIDFRKYQEQTNERSKEN